MSLGQTEPASSLLADDGAAFEFMFYIKITAMVSFFNNSLQNINIHYDDINVIVKSSIFEMNLALLIDVLVLFSSVKDSTSRENNRTSGNSQSSRQDSCAVLPH